MKNTLLLLPIFLFVISGCQNSVHTSFMPSEQSTTDTSGQQGIGIRNFEQIYATMTQVTGIDPMASGNTSISNYYNNNKTSLPATNELSNLQANHLIAIMNLATKYCALAGSNATIRQNFYAGTNFGTPSSTFNSQKPSTLLETSTQKIELAEFLLNKFWGNEIQTTRNRSDAISTLTALMDDVASGYADTNQFLIAVMDSVCTAALASGPVIYL
jgi:hypothetical protein